MNPLNKKFKAAIVLIIVGGLMGLTTAADNSDILRPDGTAYDQNEVDLIKSLTKVKSRLVINLESGKQQTVITYGTSLTASGAWVGLVKCVT